MSYFERFKKITPKRVIPNFKINRPLAPNVVLGDVGLELEIEGVRLVNGGDLPTTKCPVTGGGWTTHVDGSLRGEALEYVFDRPCSIAAAETLVNDLFEKFQKNETTLQLSNRCSTHVHLNVSDWTVNYIISFFAIWAAIEPALIEWCGVERKTNHFCLSMVDTTAAVDHWSAFLKDGPLGVKWSQNLKYTALNPLHLFDFGSLEIRCGRAPDNAGDIVNWTKFLWALREFVKGFPNPQAIPELVSFSSPSGIILDLAARAGIPAFGEEILGAAPTANEDGLETFREVQALCCAFPWNEWVEDAGKAYVPNPFESEKKLKIRTDNLVGLDWAMPAPAGARGRD